MRLMVPIPATRAHLYFRYAPASGWRQENGDWLGWALSAVPVPAFR